MNAPRREFSRLPGWELVAAGVDDLRAGRETVAAMLVKSAEVRLRKVGVDVPGGAVDDPHLRMFELVELEVGEGRAHSRYNALRRRLLSFLASARHAT